MAHFDLPGVGISPLPEVAADYKLLGLDGYCDYRFYKPLTDHLCGLIHPANILEVGFFLGSSAYCWLSSAASPRVVSCDLIVDAAHDCLRVIRNSQRLSTHFGNRLLFIPKSSQFVYDDIKHIRFGLAFVDGRHDYDGVREDLELCARLGVTYVYLDDFHDEVARAYTEGLMQRYLPMHVVRFENGAKTNPIDGLLAKRVDTTP